MRVPPRALRYRLLCHFAPPRFHRASPRLRGPRRGCHAAFAVLSL